MSYQIGGAACALCGAPGTNKTTCPLNPQSKNPNPAKHNARAAQSVQRVQKVQSVQRVQKAQPTQIRQLPAHPVWERGITLGDRLFHDTLWRSVLGQLPAGANPAAYDDAVWADPNVVNYVNGTDLPLSVPSDGDRAASDYIEGFFNRFMKAYLATNPKSLNDASVITAIRAAVNTSNGTVLSKVGIAAKTDSGRGALALIQGQVGRKKAAKEVAPVLRNLINYVTDVLVNSSFEIAQRRGSDRVSAADVAKAIAKDLQ